MKQNEPSEPTSGDRIRLWRRERGLSLQELAEKAGLSITFLSDIERSKKIPSVTTLRRVAEALETSLHQLIPNEDYSGESVSKEDFLESLRPHLKARYSQEEAAFLRACFLSMAEFVPTRLS